MQPLGDARARRVLERHAHRRRIGVGADDAAARRCAPRGARAPPSRSRSQSSGSWPRQPRKPKYSRPSAGATSPAISAASVRKVPEPHIGSTSAPPARSRSRPPCAQQNRGRDVFLERRAPALDPIAAPVQALTREVHRHERGGALHMQVQPHVGPLRLDVRALPRRFAQPVAHRVFQELRAVERVADGGVRSRCTRRRASRRARGAGANRCASRPRRAPGRSWPRLIPR